MNNNSTIIDFVRHGKSLDNVNEVVSGRSTTELSEEGLKQAEEFKTDIAYDAIIYSSLKRAKQTAKIISKKFPSADLVETDLIVEKYYGNIEGRKWKELEIEFPQFKENIYDIGDHSELIKGEDIASIDKRTDEFISILKSKFLGKKILVISHGGLQRVLIKKLRNLNEEDLKALHPKNLEIIRVELQNNAEDRS